MDCDRCQIWTQLQDPSVKIILHHNTAELIDGIRRECWWCIRILKHLQYEFKSLPDSLQGHPSDISYATVSESSFEFRSFARLDISSDHYWKSSAHFEINGKHDVLCHLDFSTRRRKPKEASNYIPHAMVDNTNSQQTWDYVTGRLKNCEVNHVSCQQLLSYMPSRLIEIREENGKFHFRLILTSNDGPRGRYITLSHRWGKDVTLRLTTQNLYAFMVEIPQQKMPQKYIDAAVIALRLKIPYLWIDSLCIIQDSSDDWDQESGTMDLVYRHAYCNLAATSAINSSEGLFYRRSSIQLCPHKVHLSKLGASLIYNDSDTTLFVKLDTEPLNLRGWVCQERLLATRNISFTQRLVYFECAEELSCEAMDSTEAPCGFRFDLTCRDLWSLASLRNMSFEDAQLFWHEILSFYSTAHVTVASDRLVAISGIAKFCQPAFRSDYLAGLWTINLARDLCWYSKSGLGHVLDYRAPSWSWASINGRVAFRHIGEYRELVDFTDTYLAPTIRTNPYGAIHNSWIRLIGWVFPIFHKGCDACVHQQRRISETSSFRSRVENFIEDMMEGWASLAEIDDNSLKVSELNALSPLEPMDCFLLPIVCEDDDGCYTQLRLYCLILAAVTPSRGIYQRIGLLDFAFDLMNDRIWATSEDSPDEDPQSSEQMVEYVLLLMKQKFQHCKVPSHEGNTLERHEITLV
ncbi:heterokaryon incompatibility protein-domain-containing protein [Annulohypoxylon maeteangense]|uniref:heterokaryon incompatibility protein-domain-containing protein n=1 Tax=Annulohypoxylon maeteangense TaxID=1927788 RepID=UPI0020079B61|nr:heterokaryon incompatibility protein-domain-containing protein [Annulohypoxylon maeteangense]KAI0888480.1 heterokaryon incompatibility protein-domain-containing protein [Annulohypoxylon maeteangense]